MICTVHDARLHIHCNVLQQHLYQLVCYLMRQSLMYCTDSMFTVFHWFASVVSLLQHQQLDTFKGEKLTTCRKMWIFYNIYDCICWGVGNVWYYTHQTWTHVFGYIPFHWEQAVFHCSLKSVNMSAQLTCLHSLWMLLCLQPSCFIYVDMCRVFLPHPLN